jgi:galactose mutarotase-like enzyme
MMKLVDKSSIGTSIVEIAPERGGMVTRFAVGPRELFYLDEATFRDATKNVRGGNPVLFPSPGPLANDRFTWGGRSGSMKQHGFARNRPWTVTSSSDRSLSLELISDEATRGQFPWDFRVLHSYSLSGRCLRVAQWVENNSNSPMPFAFGFHPYFFVRDADKSQTKIETSATRAFDNVTKKEIDVGGPIDLTQKEVDLHLFDHGKTEAVLDLADGAYIIVRASPEYHRWVIWTLAGKDFVCLEPWTAGADALNQDGKAIVLAPGETKELFVEIEAA